MQQIGAPKRVERTVGVVLGVWLLVACMIGAAGLFYGMPASVVGATNGVLITLVVLAIYGIRSLRAWTLHVSLRWLILYHVVRLPAGVGFLVLHARGALPDSFALVAGWGDILVAVAALVVAILAVPMTTRLRWWAVLLWNVFGLADILQVLGTALRSGAADPRQVVAITAFPMSLLPTFVVPLVLVTHMLIFARLWRTRSG